MIPWHLYDDFTGKRLLLEFLMENLKWVELRTLLSHSRKSAKQCLLLRHGVMVITTRQLHLTSFLSSGSAQA